MKVRLKQDVPRYARLTKGIIVDAEPVTNHPELMRVKGFGALERERGASAELGVGFAR